MAFRLTDGPGPGPHPTDVPGYESAQARGLLPSVPTDPPAPVVFSSVKAMWWAFGFTAAMFMSMAAAEPIGGAAFVTPVFLGFGGILAGIVVPYHLSLREYAAGYARTDFRVTTPLNRRWWRFQGGAGPSGAEWDLRGLWLLDSHDRPVRPPVDGALPPGYYPSPHRAGQLEYWTGREWTEGFRHPTVPFLETPA